MDRANNIPSKNEWKTEEAITVKKALNMNGYSNRFIHKTLERRNQTPQNNERPISTAQIPYVKGLSERVCGILKDFKIRGVMRTQTLKDVLSHPKDAVPMGQKQVLSIKWLVQCVLKSILAKLRGDWMTE